MTTTRTTHETTEARRTWGFGVGQAGCLYDHQEDGYATKAAAAEHAREMYDLTEGEARTLLTEGIYWPKRVERREELGFGDYIELYETVEAKEEEAGNVLEQAGYTDCACRDCFELAIGVQGKAMCNGCTGAGCELNAECQRPDAYGVDEEPTEPDHKPEDRERALGALGAWHNTGRNGQASQVWVRQVRGNTAEARVMPYRVMLDLWRGDWLKTTRVEEGVPFETLHEAQVYADRWLAGQS